MELIHMTHVRSPLVTQLYDTPSAIFLELYPPGDTKILARLRIRAEQGVSLLCASNPRVIEILRGVHILTLGCLWRLEGGYRFEKRKRESREGIGLYYSYVQRKTAIFLSSQRYPSSDLLVKLTHACYISFTQRPYHRAAMPKNKSTKRSSVASSTAAGKSKSKRARIPTKPKSDHTSNLPSTIPAGKPKQWGKVYSSNPVLPAIPEVSLTDDQERRLQLAKQALPDDEPDFFLQFRTKILRQIIHQQTLTTSRISLENMSKFEYWMTQIREQMYTLHIPEYAEYMHVVLIQTQEGRPHPFVFTLCPTSPKLDIPSQDISMLSYGDKVTNTNTVQFLQKLSEVIPDFGNDYGGPIPGIINLNFQHMCPGTLRTYEDLCKNKHSTFFSAEEDDVCSDRMSDEVCHDVWRGYYPSATDDCVMDNADTYESVRPDIIRES
eukprot:scaffold19275_cov131-Skeletonema_dohrnii-CCMP3373.AAC.2